MADLGDVQMRELSTENVADFRSNSAPEDGDSDDVTNAPENCETGSGCRNGCETPLGAEHISTISRGEFQLRSFGGDDGSSTTLTSSATSSSGVTETGSARTNCSTPPDVGLTTSSVRETAIMGDSSDERLDGTGNSPVTSGDDVIRGASVIRRPLCDETNSTSQPPSLDTLNRDFVTRLDRGPETDILFSESASDVGRNYRIKPEVETYLRLPPPPTLPLSRDVKRLDNLPAMNAASPNRTTEEDNRHADVVEYPEVSSTASTTTTMMSLGK